ncbi:hypothetical protein EW093_04455 [Thiospirochaeta perfilievii]|uniref:Spore coat protein CotH n=1 Tax=Thiospirochaeta perfilievii TaxID=252967 RepID=A0A5C1QCR2_9SPIO|nr:CotH kinase family protein [Thiospirochaeta perfilievii]QEN03982.1 hypothetical protein EW093_04455 [Thiospirochaeta perfilievii]
MKRFKKVIILLSLINISTIIFGNNFNKIFDHTVIHEIEIQISQSEWDGILSDMAINKRTGNYREAKFIYRGLAGDEVIDIVGFRTRGNTTRRYPEVNGKYQRAHFKINFDKKFHGLSKLNLKWNYNKDPSQIRELYSYDMLNKAGVFAPKTGSAKLYIKIGDKKRVDFGIYTLIEPIDKSFLKRRFGSDANDGNLYKCLWQQGGSATLYGNITKKIGVKDWTIDYRPSYDRKTNEEDTDYSDLINFAKNISRLKDSEYKEYMEDHFEIDRFLRYQAMAMLLGMPDDYWAMGNNYYLYFNNITGKIDFIPYDYDHGLGGGWEGMKGYKAIQEADIYTWLSNRSVKPLLRLLDFPEYKELYEGYLKEFIQEGGIFSFTTFKEKYDQQYKLYFPLLVNDMHEGEDMELKKYIPEYFENKLKSITSQLK